LPLSSQIDADLANPAVLAEPHEMFDQLRREEPVYWSDPLSSWFVTSHEIVTAALRDPRLSSVRTEAFVLAQLGPENAKLAADFQRVVGAMMLMKDGEDHRRLRILGNHGLTPSMLHRSRPMIEQIVNELLSAVADKGRMDIMADLAQPLPAQVIAALFDIPESDRDLFQEASDAMAKFFGATLGDKSTDARAANAATRKLEAYFLKLIEERSRRPGQDLMSLFLAGQKEGKLTAEEVCCQCILLLVAGHVTTIDQLSNAVHALLTHRDELERLQQDPALLESAVEEAVRFDTAVPMIYRLAKEDVVLGGKTIRAGQIVHLCLIAASHDPAAYAEPHRFDITRAAGRSLAFGQGIHICMGGGLARCELEIALSALLARCPNLRLDPDHPPQRNCASLAFRGFHLLAVRY
jgi:pimeloyl-[acyl-carrier protein] synthase